MQIAALIKQIPVFEDMALGDDGRLIRDGLDLHINDYCRRAIAKGIELATASGGALTVITLGPPCAENVLREALACGADSGILVSDPAFAGSDTLATAMALAAAVERLGGFDLILCGRNSVDADTGQVPPQVAELLGVPFATGAKELSLAHGILELGLEHDDEWVNVKVPLPALISCAERLCDPCKLKDPAIWAAVDATLITTVSAAELGSGPWGEEASPTSVGAVRSIDMTRERLLLEPNDVEGIMGVLARRGALTEQPMDELAPVPAVRTEPTGRPIGIVIEPDRSRLTRELLGAGSLLATAIEGTVTALGPELADPAQLSGWGADSALQMSGADVEDQVASALTDWIAEADPWAVLAPGTAWGREVAARAAATTGSGLTGDAIELSERDGRLVADKAAFGNATVAEILCDSSTQMATVRPGVLPLLTPRSPLDIPVASHLTEHRSNVQVISRRRDDDTAELANAAVVIGIGQGIDPRDYPQIDSFAAQIDASLCATRKVTDQNWLPRARQVGITGHTITPRLYIGIGLSGKFNHIVGVRSAGTIVGINPDPEAPLFDWCDVGIVARWQDVLPGLIPALAG